jgi:hypothetical protein
MAPQWATRILPPHLLSWRPMKFRTAGGPYTTLTGCEPDATLQFSHETSREHLSEQVLE